MGYFIGSSLALVILIQLLTYCNAHDGRLAEEAAHWFGHPAASPYRKIVGKQITSTSFGILSQPPVELDHPHTHIRMAEVNLLKRVNLMLTSTKRSITMMRRVTRSNGVCRKTLRKCMEQMYKFSKIYIAGDYFHAQRKLVFVTQGLGACMRQVQGSKYAPLKQANVTVTAMINTLETLINSSPPPSDSPQSPQGSPLTASTIDYGGTNGHAIVSSNNWAVKFDEAGGGRIRSSNTFTSGLFSADIQCAAGDTSGLDATYYLSTEEGEPGQNAITLEFTGKAKTQVQLNVAQDGKNHNPLIVDLGFDCSLSPHKYTIIWTQSVISWTVDDKVLAYYTPEMAAAVGNYWPRSVRMYLYASIWDASSNPYWAGPLSLRDAPYWAHWQNIMFTPATDHTPLPLPSIPSTSQPLVPMGMDYCADHIDTTALGSSHAYSITFDKWACGGRTHSTRTYSSGTFSGRVKCPAGNASGLVTSFYLSSLEGDHKMHEIDFEWLGKSNTIVQTNFYVNGVGNHEVIINLGFDCSAAFHTYTIDYKPSAIRWYVDGILVRTVVATEEELYPTKPMFLYTSIWNASMIASGKWSGVWSGADMPYLVQFEDVTIISP